MKWTKADDPYAFWFEGDYAFQSYKKNIVESWERTPTIMRDIDRIKKLKATKNIDELADYLGSFGGFTAEDIKRNFNYYKYGGLTDEEIANMFEDNKGGKI